MKLTVKLIGIAMVLFVCAILLVTSLNTQSTAYLQSNAQIKVCVVDLEGKPVHNAKVGIVGDSIQFYTDNNGNSPLVDLSTRQNAYNPEITQWYTINLQISKSGYVDAFVLNCVVYVANVRNVTVRVYSKDSSDLPFVCYVESPPNDYLQGLIDQK